MRVALNAQLLSHTRTYRSGGISRVIHELLRELVRDGRGHTYDVFAPVAPAPGEPLAALRFHPTGPATARPPLRVLWEQAALPARLRSLAPDLLHSLAYASPLRWRGPTVLSVYDLSFMRFPETFNRGNRLYLSAIVRLSARRARRILTISRHSKSDIVRLLGVPAERVDVTYPAADGGYRVLPREQVEAFRQARGLPDRFVFYLGTLEPRKNLVGLLEAYARLPEGWRPPLYVAGASGWRYTPVFEAVTRLRLERDARFLGFIPEEEMPLWYNAARLFAFPSLYEGFGLPVVEAMACGTPVITSLAASLPEAAGDAALLVDPRDVESLARALRGLLADESELNSMRARGLAQAGRFSWADLATRTVRSYERALAA